MGQGSSSPKTIKTNAYSLRSNEYSTVYDTNILKYIRCNFYTAKQYRDIDKNLIPKNMCKIRRTVNVGNTKITDPRIRKKIFNALEYDTKEHGDNIEMYQYTMNKEQLRKLEETIDNILDSFGRGVIGGRIPGPIYVAYSKILEYNGSYLTRYCDKVKYDKNENKSRYFTDLSNELKRNRELVDSTISARYVWKGNIDLIILIPNMNNLNRIHTNMFDFYINNEITNYLVNNDFMNNIIPNDISKYPNYIKRKIYKKHNFEHDTMNICMLHGCNSGNNTEDLDVILPSYSKDDSTMRANTKLTKLYLPNKCLRPVDYVKNGYNPNGKDVRKELKFDYNVDYTDIVFEMIFCMAIDCMFKTADKETGVAKRWNNYIDKLRRNPNSLEDDEFCDDNIIKHMNSYVYECIKGTPAEEKAEDEVQLDLKPIKVEKNHYTKWNNDIMKELAERRTKFPGVQEYVYPFFKLVVNNSKIRNRVFYLPWGNRFLKNEEFLVEGDFKKEIKSHNNVYRLFTNQNGQVGIKRNNTIIKWISLHRFPVGEYGMTLTTDCKININSNNNATVLILKLTDETKFKLPISLIINDNGSIVLYENGFKQLKMNKNISVVLGTVSTVSDDIKQINKIGIFNYLIDKKPSNESKGSKGSKESKESKDKIIRSKCDWITTEIENFTNDKCNERLNEIINNGNEIEDQKLNKIYEVKCKWNLNEII